MGAKEERFYFMTFNGSNGWVINKGSINMNSNSSNCPDVDTNLNKTICWNMGGGAEANYTISAIGYHSLRIEIDVTETVSDDISCFLKYYTDGDSKHIQLATNGQNTRLNVNVTLPDTNSYNNASELHLMLGVSGTNGNNNNCYYDNMKIFGTPYNYIPTELPTTEPTTAPTISTYTYTNQTECIWIIYLRIIYYLEDVMISQYIDILTNITQYVLIGNLSTDIIDCIIEYNDTVTNITNTSLEITINIIVCNDETAIFLLNEFNNSFQDDSVQQINDATTLQISTDNVELEADTIYLESPKTTFVITIIETKIIDDDTTNNNNTKHPDFVQLIIAFFVIFFIGLFVGIFCVICIRKIKVKQAKNATNKELKIELLGDQDAVYGTQQNMTRSADDSSYTGVVPGLNKMDSSHSDALYEKGTEENVTAGSTDKGGIEGRRSLQRMSRTSDSEAIYKEQPFRITKDGTITGGLPEDNEEFNGEIQEDQDIGINVEDVYGDNEDNNAIELERKVKHTNITDIEDNTNQVHD